MPVKLEVYYGRKGLNLRKQYRWRVRAANGRILATGSEGYNNLGDIHSAITSIVDVLDEALNNSVPIHVGSYPK